jgi:hypothetical protein
MPDDIQPTPTAVPQEPIAPVLPNPQDMVDAALSGDAATPKVEVSEPAKIEPLPPLPPLTPLTPPVSEPTPEPVSVAPTLPPTPDPITPPVAAPVAVTMGDDTPLAFAGIPAPTVTPTDINPAVATESPTTPPPDMGAPLPPIAPQAPEVKKKGKLGKIVAGLMIAVLAIAGGIVGYQYLTIGESPLIAVIVHLPNGGTIDVGSGSGQDSKVTHDDVIKAESKEKKNQKDGESEAETAARLKAAADAEYAKLQQKLANDTAINNAKNCDPTDQGGLGCPVKCTSANAYWTPVTEPGGGSYCNAQGKLCKKFRKELKSPTGAHCFLDYGETCGGSCDVGKTTVTTPTMKCDGLTSVPATTTPPVIGTKLTFTCAGTVTPTSAGTPSYKFRYSINSGTPVTMTPLTATPNKAELTINACGTYKVECQACATLSGVLTCSPVWTGATQ